MIPCPREGYPGAMKESGFSRKYASQKCPDCGQFRRIVPGMDPPQYHCKRCDTYQDLTLTIELFVCDTCMTQRPEDHPDMKASITSS